MSVRKIITLFAAFFITILFLIMPAAASETIRTQTETVYENAVTETAIYTETAYENTYAETAYNTKSVYEIPHTETAYNTENVYENPHNETVSAKTITPPAPIKITVSAAGDFTLGGDVQSQGESRFAQSYSEHTPDWYLANVADIFDKDDITVVNLEGTLTTSDNRRKNRSFLFRGKPEYIDILTAGNVDVVNVANNHHNDFLSQGKADTISTVKNAGIGYFGYDDEYYIEKQGVTFGFLGFTEWDHTAEQITERITSAKLKCDIIIVSFHWGVERQYTPTKTQTYLGHAAVDAGADLVIGSHTHVLGEVENYNGVNIVYSLGNFCYGGHSNPADKNTMIFQQDFEIDEDGGVDISDSRIIPCSISSLSWTNNCQPTPISDKT
ncbi:MAG: CapA family protein [Ruminococcus sp.]|jgi:poly-gamma-glutamate synthesis protein (capsule biosynthesis protein)|nr:CapA family protein [Ruminococcus sp.]